MSALLSTEEINEIHEMTLLPRSEAEKMLKHQALRVFLLLLCDPPISMFLAEVVKFEKMYESIYGKIEAETGEAKVE